MREALKVFAEASAGSITELPFRWQSDDAWKLALGADADQGDDRVERFDTPQYQSETDAQQADPACPQLHLARRLTV